MINSNPVSAINVDLGALASAVKTKMEARFGKSQVEYSYFFDELDRIIKESKTGIYTSEKTDLGIAAMKTFDGDNDPMIKNISEELTNLSFLYRRKIALLSRPNKSFGS